VGESTINQEWEKQREGQLPPDLNPVPGDMLGVGQAERALAATRIGDPPEDFTVRAVYDSRPVNAYDVNLQGQVTVSGV
jgi:hypothetical protein